MRKTEKTSLMSAKAMETRYYEGCGREGPIRCIFLGEFHPVAGPKIACQFPEDYISKELFDSINAYIIPKPQIQQCTMTINALGHKIVGYPIKIDSSRYERNAYLFNLCFVCDSWSKTVQYEPVVKKLGEHLTIMEEETRFVSGGSSRLPMLLAHLLHDLNTHRRATLLEGDTVMHLKVLEVRQDPRAVRDHDVPVLQAAVGLPRPGRGGGHHDPPAAAAPAPASASASASATAPAPAPAPAPAEPPSSAPAAAATEPPPPPPHLDDPEPFEVELDADWDLTTRQLLPFINGYNHVSKIAADTNVEKTLVKSCIQNLVYYGVVTLIPVLKFSNMYRATPALCRLFGDAALQRACLAYVGAGAAGDAPGISISEVLSILCALQQGTTLRAVCERFTAAGEEAAAGAAGAAGAAPAPDVRRLIVFALLHGLIKCLKRYPVYTGCRRGVRGVRRLFTGRHCTDEICCREHIDQRALDQLIEDDPNVAVIWR